MPPAFTPSANFAPVSAEPPVAPLYVPPVGIPVLPVSIPVPEPPLQPEARSPGPADMRVAVRPAYAARRHSTSPLAVVLMVAVGVSALALTAVALVYRDQPLRPASDKGASAGAAADPGAMTPSPSRGQQ
jgi:hypothetical protein